MPLYDTGLKKAITYSLVNGEIVVTHDRSVRDIESGKWVLATRKSEVMNFTKAQVLTHLQAKRAALIAKTTTDLAAIDKNITEVTNL